MKNIPVALKLYQLQKLQNKIALQLHKTLWFWYGSVIPYIDISRSKVKMMAAYILSSSICSSPILLQPLEIAIKAYKVAHFNFNDLMTAPFQA